MSHPSPCILKSNGFSERAVQTLKDLFHKCKESGQDPHLAMLCLCSTPLSHDLPSPAELLNGRPYQTNLPAVSKPSFSANGDVNVKLQLRQDKQKVQCDKTAQQPRHSLFPEDHVRVLNPATGTWEPGIVQHVADTPRSYLVATEKGGILRRNCRHLHTTEEPFSSKTMTSLTMFQLLTLFRIQPITKSAIPAVPLFPLKKLPVFLLSHPSRLFQVQLQILLLCCHFVDLVEEFRLQID